MVLLKFSKRFGHFRIMAAVSFYSDLFGWQFEDVMPPESPGRYFMARIRGGDVAAVGSQPQGAPPNTFPHDHVVRRHGRQRLRADLTASSLSDPERACLFGHG